jgi:hypothetical protein
VVFHSSVRNNGAPTWKGGLSDCCSLSYLLLGSYPHGAQSTRSAGAHDGSLARRRRRWQKKVMSKWMQKAIEDRSRFAERRKREASDQQLHSRTLDEKAPAVWLELTNAIKTDVDTFNRHCPEEDRLSHLHDRATDPE